MTPASGGQQGVFLAQGYAQPWCRAAGQPPERVRQRHPPSLPPPLTHPNARCDWNANILVLSRVDSLSADATSVCTMPRGVRNARPTLQGVGGKFAIRCCVCRHEGDYGAPHGGEPYCKPAQGKVTRRKRVRPQTSFPRPCLTGGAPPHTPQDVRFTSSSDGAQLATMHSRRLIKPAHPPAPTHPSTHPPPSHTLCVAIVLIAPVLHSPKCPGWTWLQG